MKLPNRIVAICLASVLALTGCATPPEVDWRFRRAVLDMHPSQMPGVIGSLAVAGRVDASAFTNDALWIMVAAPTKRGLPINRLARIDLHTNRFVDLFAVGGFSGATLATGAGSVWVAEGLGGDKIHRIDANSNQHIASVTFPRNPVAIAFGEGAVWVLAAAHANHFGRILLSVTGLALYKLNPADNTISSITPIPQAAESPAQPTYGALTITAGTIWVSTRTGEVLQIDPETGTILKRFPGRQEAMAFEEAYGIKEAENAALLDQLRERSAHPVYAVASGMGTLWAFSSDNKTAENNRKVTLITRFKP